ncbi:MAG: hypothetical protein F4Y61_08800 [Rhodothermaceae bacterium]|nr:hypothetical protein [Rhodothermaceae bacterium]
MERLSQGNFTDVGDAGKIQPNYCGRAAAFLGNLGSAFPPGFDGLDDQIAAPLTTSIRRTINRVLYDTVRYGLGLWRLRTSAAGEPVLEHTEPQNWFPASTVEALNDKEPADAVIATRNEDGEKWAQVLKLTPGQWELNTHAFDGDALGDIEETETGESSQQRPLFPTALPPYDGEWGRSAYIDMAGLATELGRRFSSNSQTLDDYARPMLIMKGRAVAAYMAGPGEQTQLRAKAAMLEFDDARRQPVFLMPEGVEEVGFVQWDAQQQASFSHIDRIEDALFDMSALPSGLGRMADKLASGASLRRLWAPTYVLLETIRSDLMLNIASAVTAAGEMLGVDPGEYAIEWANPLDALDEQRIVQGGPDDMETPDDEPTPEGPQ